MVELLSMRRNITFSLHFDWQQCKSCPDISLFRHHISLHKNSCLSDSSSKQSFPCSDSGHCLKCCAAMNYGSSSFIWRLKIIFFGRLSMSHGAVSLWRLLMLNLDGIESSLPVTPELDATFIFIALFIFPAHVPFIALFIFIFHRVFFFILSKPLVFLFLVSSAHFQTKLASHCFPQCSSYHGCAFCWFNDEEPLCII